MKKIRTWKDWQSDWNFVFWQKLGDFIETKVKKSPTSPGLVSPDTGSQIINLMQLQTYLSFSAIQIGGKSWNLNLKMVGRESS